MSEQQSAALRRDALDPWLLRRLRALQFSINCLSSVAIEYPALRSHPLLRMVERDS
jgi:hypothetical protein